VSNRLEIHSHSPEHTQRIGEVLGRAFAPGDVVVLDGDLGAGKTTFTQGIARGMGIDDPVTSPTFVVAREMPVGTSGIGLTHVDAYRISSLHEWDDLDLDVESGAMVIEWGERVVPALPEDQLEIRIVGDNHARTLTIAAHGPRSARLLAALEGYR
jgi:tRNA threonylcarbamoyladenosine biosynthesis protein TsaE